MNKPIQIRKILLNIGLVFTLVIAVLIAFATHYQTDDEKAEKRASAEATESIAVEVKATMAYKISYLESGTEVGIMAPYKKLSKTLAVAAIFFNTTEDQIGSVAYAQAVRLKKMA